MKTINSFVSTLFLLFVSVNVYSQTGIEAGPNQSAVCGQPVQLNATAFNGWGVIPTIVPNTYNSFNSVYFTSSDIGYAVTTRGEIFKAYDSGAFWDQKLITGSSLNAIYFINSSTGFAAGANGSILKTTDEGATWIPVISNTSNNLRSIFFVSSSIGYIVGSSGTILKTTDGGSSWTLKTVGSTNMFYSVYFNSPDTGFICGSLGVMLKTIDGGNSWVQNTLVANNPTLNSIHFPNSTIGYITGSQGVIMKTIDGGSNWSKYQADSVHMEEDIANPKTARALINANLKSIYFTSENTGYAAGYYLSESIFIKTTDGGMNWYEQKNNLSRNTRITSICFPNDSTGYAVGNMGRVAKLSSKNFNFENISWYPSDGLSDPYIANPTANPSSTTTYYVNTLNHQAGKNFTDSVTVTVESLNLSQPKAKYAGCGGSVLLDNYKTNYTGIKKLSYKWTPSTGLSSDTVAYPRATVSGSITSYNLSIKAPGGCTASTTVLVKDSLYVNAKANKSIVCSGTAQLTSTTNYSGTGILHYKWTPSSGLNNDAIPNPTATVSSSTTYTVKITSENGCTASGDVTVSVTALTANAGSDREVTCGNSVQMTTVTTNYNGSETLRYKWTPSSGLNNDTISNPIIIPTETTTYTVQVSTASGCMATDDVIVTVNPLTANAGADKTIICGGSVKLDSVTMNSSETGKLRYKWTPSTGLNNDTIANPTASPTFTTTYTVTVTSPFGCSAKDNVIVNVNPLTVSAGTYKTAICGEKLQLSVESTNYSGSVPLKYKWTPSIGLNNDAIANPWATVDTNTTYTLEVTTPSGCSATDNVAVNLISITKPSINYVGINEKNKNILVWTKPSSAKINSFNVYKETNITNSYLKVGNVSIDSASVFVDKNSNPDVQSNKYKISALEACGSETVMSEHHKTMHLSINKGINTIWNLIWEAYEGYPVSTYNIYRGTSSSNIQIIGSLSGSNTQFSDYTAPVGNVFYQIEAVSVAVAGVKQFYSGVKSNVETTFSSRSNIASNTSGINGLFDLKEISDGFSLYPNPTNTSVRVIIDDYNLSNLKLYVFNSMGQLMNTHENIINRQQLDVSGLSEGIYMIVVQSDKLVGRQKLIIQK